MVDMRYNSQCILVFSSTTIIPKKRAHARFCVIETVFFNYLFVTASFSNVIEHDIDVMKNADYIIDMGPGGGKDGGRIVASGTIDKIKNNNESITGRYL